MSTSTPRRHFLAHVAAAAAAAPLAAAASACASAAGGSQAAAVPSPARRPAAASGGPAPTFDDSWTARVSAAKHKAVFDAPEVRDGAALFQAATYREGYKQALGADAHDVVPVIVLRHFATVLAFDDAVWAKYPVAKLVDVKPAGAKKKDPYPTFNPFARARTPAEQEFAEEMLTGLLAAGVVVLACNRAFQALTAQLAQRTGADVAAVRAEARAGMLPGIVLQPSGIYATLRAQEVGCTFMRS